jgi:hypothetical protein
MSLDVIGPSFSGAMESVAAALDSALTGVPDDPPQEAINATLFTPSATVDSNSAVEVHPFVRAHSRLRIVYTPLAWSVRTQLDALLRDLEENRLSSEGKVVIFAEESSFGFGASEIASEIARERNISQKVQVISVQFPQNIAAIRSEHARQQRERDAERRELVPSHFLELDMTGVERSSDLPPVYQPSLSSRSDELMLYQTLEALNTYVHPEAVVIVATDIRDRLFMVNELRNAVPGALRVVLEQDNLLVHPDYRSIDRGTLVVPAGDTVVCLDAEHKTLQDCQRRDPPPHYFSFATDYAANMFRAGVVLLSKSPPYLDPMPPLLVATLAGLQSITVPKSGRKRNILVAADTRVELQRPLYLSFIAAGMGLCFVALWLLFDLSSGRILLALPRNMLRCFWSDSLNTIARVTARVPGPKLQASGSAISEQPGSADTGLLLRPVPFGIPLLLGCSVATVLISSWRTYLIWACRSSHPCFANDSFDLAHGRDAWALVCVLLVFVSLAVISLTRTELWNRRYDVYANQPELSQSPGVRRRSRGYCLSIMLAFSFVGALILCIADLTPTAADSFRVGGAATFGLLGAGGFFLMLFWIQLSRWQRVCRGLARTIKTVNGQRRLAHWPTPRLLGESPSSPFNLVIHEEDLRTLRSCDLERWGENAAHLVNGSWPFVDEKATFAGWQSQLVTEMKVASIAVRTCAWCAVLAPALALGVMQVYPPGYERVQVIGAVALLVLSSAAIIFAALVLEKDRLLGRMFTLDEDHLTLGGIVGAIWPKLLGLGTLLAAVFLPDVWDWLHSILKVFSGLH